MDFMFSDLEKALELGWIRATGCSRVTGAAGFGLLGVDGALKSSMKLLKMLLVCTEGA